MKGLTTIRLFSPLVLASAIAVLFASAAYAQGGAVSHHYAPPPLDAGSALPNPDYLPGVRPSNYPRPDDRATRPSVYGSQTAVKIRAGTSGNGFDWADAGIGAAGGLGVILVATGSAIVLRSRRRSLAAT
jgi:hypothetical protein